METIVLGRTGLKVSPLCIGTWQLGGPVSFGGKPGDFQKMDCPSVLAALLLGLDSVSATLVTRRKRPSFTTLVFIKRYPHCTHTQLYSNASSTMIVSSLKSPVLLQKRSVPLCARGFQRTCVIAACVHSSRRHEQVSCEHHVCVRASMKWHSVGCALRAYCRVGILWSHETERLLDSRNCLCCSLDRFRT